jgi:hypothetical protein
VTQLQLRSRVPYLPNPFKASLPYIYFYVSTPYRHLNHLRFLVVSKQLLSFAAVNMFLRNGAVLSVAFSLLSSLDGTWASTLTHKRAAIDDWVAKQSSVAFAGVLANIGSEGAKSYNAAEGLVLASPSTTNPDCKYFDPRRKTTNYHRLFCLDAGLGAGFQNTDRSIHCHKGH